MRKVAKKVCKLSLFSQLSAPIKSGVTLVADQQPDSSAHPLPHFAGTNSSCRFSSSGFYSQLSYLNPYPFRNQESRTCCVAWNAKSKAVPLRAMFSLAALCTSDMDTGSVALHDKSKV